MAEDTFTRRRTGWLRLVTTSGGIWTGLPVAES